MKECIFCKIVRGDSPSWTVYENDLVKAFFDINPVSEGHTIVIPKKHYENIYDIPEKELKRIILVCKRLAKIYKKTLKVKAVNIMHASGSAARQSVFHFHIHLVPRYEGDKLSLWFKPQPEIKASFDELLRKIKRGINE